MFKNKIIIHLEKSVQLKSLQTHTGQILAGSKLKEQI